jgi:hypothetical protein
MKAKLNCNTLCILLGIILIGLLLRAATNKGRLWGKGDEYFQDATGKYCTPRTGCPRGYKCSPFKSCQKV